MNFNSRFEASSSTLSLKCFILVELVPIPIYCLYQVQFMLASLVFQSFAAADYDGLSDFLLDLI